MLVVMVALLSFGVVSIVTGNKGIANKTTFVSGNENVFVEINAKYNGPELASAYRDTYYYRLDSNNSQAFQDTEVVIDGWALGNVDLSFSKNEMTMVYSFKNLNQEYPLKVTISDFGFDPTGRLKTYYEIADSEELLASAEKIHVTSGTSSAIPTLTIPTNTTKWIKLSFELTKFDKQISIDNNIKFLFDVELPA